MQETFFINHLTEKKILSPLLEVAIETMSKDNLLSSACLELFEYIKKENVKELIKFLIANHRDQLTSLSYLATFRELILRFDQTRGYTANMDYFIDGEEEIGRKPPPNARMMEHITVDPQQEEYWNTSDPEDEEEEHIKPAGKTLGSNGPPTPSRPLVDYPSDEEADESQDSDSQSKDSSSEGAVPSQDPDSPLVGPPERLSEKRRREEDEDDELGKLMHNKRRNSSSSESNSAASSRMTPRRKSFTAGSGNGTPKKIAISLSPALKSGGGSARSDEES